MTALIKLADQLSETTVDDEVVIMHLDSGDFFSLKDSAKAIWELIDGARSREDVMDALAGDYGIAREQIAHEVDDFLARLCEAGLLARSR